MTTTTTGMSKYAKNDAMDESISTTPETGFPEAAPAIPSNPAAPQKTIPTIQIANPKSGIAATM
jgi:hypothetical protein